MTKSLAFFRHELGLEVLSKVLMKQIGDALPPLTTQPTVLPFFKNKIRSVKKYKLMITLP